MAAVDELNVIDFEAYRSRRQPRPDVDQPGSVNASAMIGFYWFWPTIFWIPAPVVFVASVRRGNE